MDIYDAITDEKVRTRCLDGFVKIHIGRYEYLKKNNLGLEQYID